MRMIKRTRFKFGGAQILGRDVMAMGEMLGMGGPAGLAVTAGMAAYKIESALVNNTVRNGTTALDAYNITGGTPGQAAQVQALSGGNPGRANELGDLLRGGSYGAARMRARGIVDLGMWTTNKATNYIKTMDAMRGMSRQERTMIGRDLNMTPAEMRLAEVKDTTYNDYKHSMDWMGNKKAMDQANEYDTSVETLKRSMEGIKNAVGLPLVDPFKERAQGANDILQGGNDSFSDAAIRKLRGAMRMAGGIMRYGPIGWIANGFLNAPGMKNFWSRGDLPQNNEETPRGSFDYRGSRPENIGGGARSMNAIPMQMNYGAVVNGLESDVYRMGAF